MSIYPVRLKEWFPFGDEYYDFAYITVKHTRCYACGDRVRYSRAIGHHSIPWGYGDIWCSEKCLNSNKKARPDKRRERRLNRRSSKFGDIDWDKWVKIWREQDKKNLENL